MLRERDERRGPFKSFLPMPPARKQVTKEYWRKLKGLFGCCVQTKAEAEADEEPDSVPSVKSRDTKVAQKDPKGNKRKEGNPSSAKKPSFLICKDCSRRGIFLRFHATSECPHKPVLRLDSDQDAEKIQVLVYVHPELSWPHGHEAALLGFCVY